MSSSSIRSDEILLATDFCDPARHALAWARQLARLRGSSVRAVHVIDLTGDAASGTPSFSIARDSAERRLRELRRELRLAGVAGSATLIAGGKPALAIRDTATRIHAGLLVLGINGTRSRRASTLGSTAKALLAHPPCPIVTVAAQQTEHAPARSPGPTLFVTDATTASLHAGLRAWPPAASLPPEAVLRAVSHPGQSGRLKFSPEVRESFASLRTIALEGSADAILREAAQIPAGLIVLCLQAGSPLDGYTRGDFAHALITGAPCPVLTVRC